MGNVILIGGKGGAEHFLANSKAQREAGVYQFNWRAGKRDFCLARQEDVSTQPVSTGREL